MPVPRALSLLTIVGVVTLALTACGLTIPTDPDGSLDRIDGGVLRVGASQSGGLVDIGGGEVEGPLADLVEKFAASRDAQVEWTVGSEEDLVDALEEGALDLAVGGMTDATPWMARVSVTRAYDDLPGTSRTSVVVLLPLGENALQSAVETFLDDEVSR